MPTGDWGEGLCCDSNGVHGSVGSHHSCPQDFFCVRWGLQSQSKGCFRARDPWNLPSLPQPTPPPTFLLFLWVLQAPLSHAHILSGPSCPREKRKGKGFLSDPFPGPHPLKSSEGTSAQTFSGLPSRPRGWAVPGTDEVVSLGPSSWPVLLPTGCANQQINLQENRSSLLCAEDGAGRVKV